MDIIQYCTGIKREYLFIRIAKQELKITVLFEGTQACRFDKIDNKNTLIINELWDYNRPGWGNYTKRIKSEGEFEGKVLLHFGD